MCKPTKFWYCGNPSHAPDAGTCDSTENFSSITECANWAKDSTAYGYCFYAGQQANCDLICQLEEYYYCDVIGQGPCNSNWYFDLADCKAKTGKTCYTKAQQTCCDYVCKPKTYQYYVYDYVKEDCVIYESIKSTANECSLELGKKCYPTTFGKNSCLSEKYNCPICPAGKPLFKNGNANCDDKIDASDFEIWRSEKFDIASTTYAWRADFSCINGTRTTKPDINDFQVWWNGRYSK
jgi:hypothetical protein